MKEKVKFVGSKKMLGSPLNDLSCIKWIKESHVIDGIIYAIDFLPEKDQVIITYALLDMKRKFLSTDCYVEVKQIKSLRLTYEMFDIFITSEKALYSHLSFNPRRWESVATFRIK